MGLPSEGYLHEALSGDQLRDTLDNDHELISRVVKLQIKVEPGGQEFDSYNERRRMVHFAKF